MEYKKHPTIVDFFDKETCLKTLEGMILKRIMPDVITLEILRCANVKPPKQVPIPLYHYMLDSEECELAVDKPIKLVVWVSHPYTVSSNIKDGLNAVDKECVDTINILVNDKMSFKEIKFIPGIYDQFYEVVVVLDTYPITKCIDMKYFLKKHALLIEHLPAQEVYGVSYINGSIFSVKPVAIYLDPYQKQNVKKSGYKHRNYHDPDKVKYVYVDFSDYEEFENFRIHRKVFAKLLKLGKSIEDLNYATKLVIKNIYDNPDEDFYETYISDNVEITFGEKKLRNLTFEDYHTNVLLFRICVNLEKYEFDCFANDNIYLNTYKKEEVLWCGIPFSNDSNFLLGNLYIHTSFNSKKRTFEIDAKYG